MRRGSSKIPVFLLANSPTEPLDFNWRQNGGVMKIDKEHLKKLAQKSDEELWREVLTIAKSHGYTLPEAMPKHEDIEKIRRALSGAEKISLTDAAKIMNSYKKNK